MTAGMDIRCSTDKKLFESLLAERQVAKVREQVAQLEEKGPLGVRRRLLATSVRLSSTMAPGVHAIAGECIDALGIDIPVELYVYASPQFNAACVKPEEGRLFVMFSSALLENFRGRELCFVMGHELGHHLYGHHDIPIGWILNGSQNPGPQLALKLFAWSRYAEVSADRAGAHCARDFESVGRALFRMTSGLGDDIIDFDLRAFLAQIDDMQAGDAGNGPSGPREDWFSTHPFSPLRVKALALFFRSGLAPAGKGMSGADLDVAVQGLMSLMEPSYLEGRTEAAEAMRRLLFAGAIAVADASDGISEEEIAVFEKFFGDGAYTERLDLQRLRQEMPRRAAQARELTSPPQRMQVIRDLCLVARADGRTTAPERRVLEAVAGALNVPLAFISQTLNDIVELD